LGKKLEDNLVASTPLKMPTKYDTLLLIHVFKINLSKLKKKKKKKKKEGNYDTGPKK